MKQDNCKEKNCHKKKNELLVIVRCNDYIGYACAAAFHFLCKQIPLVVMRTRFGSGMSAFVLAFRLAAMVRTTRSRKAAEVAEDKKRRL